VPPKPYVAVYASSTVHSICRGDTCSIACSRCGATPVAGLWAPQCLSLVAARDKRISCSRCICSHASLYGCLLQRVARIRSSRMERICGAGLMLPGRDVLESSSGMPLSSVSRKEDTAVLPLHFCVQPGSVRAPGKSHRDVPVVRYRHVVGRGLQVAAARFWVDGSLGLGLHRSCGPAVNRAQ
jgi:hypothetical protein